MKILYLFAIAALSASLHAQPEWKFACTVKACPNNAEISVNLNSETGLFEECHNATHECREIPKQRPKRNCWANGGWHEYFGHNWYRDCVVPYVKAHPKEFGEDRNQP